MPTGADLLPALRSRASAHDPSNGIEEGPAVADCCVVLPDGNVLVGRLVAAKSKSNLRVQRDADSAKGPTCMRAEAALVTTHLANVQQVILCATAAQSRKHFHKYITKRGHSFVVFTKYEGLVLLAGQHCVGPVRWQLQPLARSKRGRCLLLPGM